ncbi:cob(I)yrinic acid a,c-diamide adenosyltransferase [soil metagenome]
MKIYTKTGDRGTTALFGGKRVSKYDPQIEASGALDEATSFIGSAISAMSDPSDKDFLSSIQHDLYAIMGYLAGAPFKKKEIETKTHQFEKKIDEIDKSLPPLTRFILPQGSEVASRIHISRAIIRSAERRVVAYISTKDQNDQDTSILQYLNRLSDLFFMLARKYSEKDVLT